MEPGDQFGEYRLGRRLGRGGQGEVFEATDSLGLTWALKIGHPVHTNDAKALANFSKEAAWVNKTLGGMPRDRGVFVGEHYGVWEDRFYVKMRLLDGESLSERLAREGQLPLERALTLSRQVASAVVVAHEHNALHRDLKPANIFIEQGGRVQVLDWGCIQLLEAGLFATSTTSGPMCTVGYAALEQYEPSRAPLSRAVDVYGLGVVLLETLVGINPFTGKKRGPKQIDNRTHTRQSAQITRGVRERGDAPTATLQPTTRAAPGSQETGKTETLGELLGDNGSTMQQDSHGFGQESWGPAGTVAAVIRHQMVFKLSQEPELTRELPGPVVKLLDRMLEPDANRRISDMAAVIAELDELLIECSAPEPAQVTKSPRTRRLAAAGAAFVVLGGLTAAFATRGEAPSARADSSAPASLSKEEPPSVVAAATTELSPSDYGITAQTETLGVLGGSASNVEVSSTAPAPRRRKAKPLKTAPPEPPPNKDSAAKVPAVRPFFDRKE